MELLECPRCRRRYIAADSGGDARWHCSHCHDALTLVVRSLPGSAEQIARELNAQQLGQPGSEAEAQASGSEAEA